MKLLTYKSGTGKKENIGILTAEGTSIIPLTSIDPGMEGMGMIDFIKDHTPAEIALLSKAEERKDHFTTFELDLIQVVAPISRPVHDILCVGVNYMSHLNEAHRGLRDDNFTEKPEKTIYFGKRASRIIGTGDPIEARADLDRELDYEVELAVIIGKEGKDIPREEAEEYIFGYSVFNDITSRTLQRDHVQYLRGKSLDTFSIMGPVIVTRDELPFPLELDVLSSVNGEIRQHSNTKHMINDVADIIADLSAGMTLEPGDIIATGTPAGVAMGMENPVYLKPGDKVACAIPKIGMLINEVI